MEHFKRFAFCMLYLFTFIWQLSAQVKKIPGQRISPVGKLSFKRIA